MIFLIFQIIPKDWDEQIVFLQATLLHPLVLQHPLKWSNQIAFLKQCIAILESINAEIRDEFYEHLVFLQSQQTTAPQKWIFKHYCLPNTPEIISVKETPQIISEGTTGLSAWQAGIFLADWMTCNRRRFEGKRLLELGSGTGATGLIIIKSCGPQEIILSDCHERVLGLLRDNVELNGCQDSVVRVVDLNWCDPSPTLDSLAIDPDVVLAADVVYDDTIFRPLVELLLILLRRKRSIEIFLAATVRNKETLTAFLRMAEESGLQVEMVARSGDMENNLNWDDQTEIRLFLIQGGASE